MGASFGKYCRHFLGTAHASQLALLFIPALCCVSVAVSVKLMQKDTFLSFLILFFPSVFFLFLLLLFAFFARRLKA